MLSFYSTLPPLSRINISGVHARVVSDLRVTKDQNTSGVHARVVNDLRVTEDDTPRKGLSEPFCYLLHSGSITSRPLPPTSPTSF